MNGKLFFVVAMVLVLVLFPCISAQELVIDSTVGTQSSIIDTILGVDNSEPVSGTHQYIKVDSTGTKIAWDGVGASTSMEVDGESFIPGRSSATDSTFSMDSGENIYFVFPDPVTKVTYEYTDRILKETIVLKEHKDLSFPISIDEGSRLVPWYPEGTWKIVGEDVNNDANGIEIQRPFMTDATGLVAYCDYTYDGDSLDLTCPETYQVPDSEGNMQNYAYQYPITIDPTWVSVSGHWEDTTTMPGYMLIMFNTTGNSSYVFPAGISNLTTQYLVVSGGGGGAGGVGGGGGGAGGMKKGSFLPTAGTRLDVTVGAGGSGGAVNTNGTPGRASSIGVMSILVNTTGGGYGGGYASPVGGYGGSGGGAGGTASGTYSGGTGIAEEGRSGGSISPDGYYLGAGGGGNLTVGGSASGSGPAGYGGNGSTCDITGSTIYYAGGGGGGTETGSLYYEATGGLGGGGNGARTGDGQAGTNGLGGGGGGGGTGGNGGNGGSGIVYLKYSTGEPLPNCDFTATPLLGYSPLTSSFLFTPSSTNATLLNWSWGDGTWSNGTFDSLRNTNHVFTGYGLNFTVNLSCTNTTTPITTNTTSKINYISTYNASYPKAAFTCTPTSGSPSLLVSCTNETMGGINPFVYNWSWGDGTYSISQYNPSHVYAYSGVYTVSLDVANVLANVSLSRSNYIAVSNTQNNVWYTQKQVMFKVLDYNNNVVPGVNVVATPTNTSLLDPNWLKTAYGISAEVAQQMVDSSLHQEALTGSSGEVTFTMHGSIEYTIVVDGAYSIRIYPIDTMYNVYVDRSSYTSLQNQQNYIRDDVSQNLTFYEPNSTHMTMGVDYQDFSGRTDYIQFWIVSKNNDTVMYSANQSVTGTEHIMINKTFANTRGDRWGWYYNAHHS